MPYYSTIPGSTASEKLHKCSVRDLQIPITMRVHLLMAQRHKIILYETKEKKEKKHKETRSTIKTKVQNIALSPPKKD